MHLINVNAIIKIAFVGSALGAPEYDQEALFDDVGDIVKNNNHLWRSHGLDNFRRHDQRRAMIVTGTNTQSLFDAPYHELLDTTTTSNPFEKLAPSPPAASIVLRPRSIRSLVNPLPSLVKVGNNGRCEIGSGVCWPLGLCEGDCDNDDDCQAPLKCFQRKGFETVPGCQGRGRSGNDYCFGRPSPTHLWAMGDNGSPASNYPLGLCEGDCDSNDDCQNGLKCFQRRGGESVPGCDGSGKSKMDYCYLETSAPATPAPTPMPLTASPSFPALNRLKHTGNNGSPTQAYPLAECEGECDFDSDCQGELLCFQRTRSVLTVPGCSGQAIGRTDYCATRPTESTLFLKVGSNGQPSRNKPLGLCEGNCETDSDCQGSLQCKHRSGNEVVPGCEGAGTTGANYCHDPRPGPKTSSPTPQRTAKPITNHPTTGQPTAGQPTATSPMTLKPTTGHPTTDQPTTGQPTKTSPLTTKPTTDHLASVKPTSVQPTTASPKPGKPTTSKPQTGQPTTGKANTTRPTTKLRSLAAPTTGQPTTGVPTTVRPAIKQPTSAKPTTGQPMMVQPPSCTGNNYTYYVTKNSQIQGPAPLPSGCDTVIAFHAMGDTPYDEESNSCVASSYPCSYAGAPEPGNRCNDKFYTESRKKDGTPDRFDNFPFPNGCTYEGGEYDCIRDSIIPNHVKPNADKSLFLGHVGDIVKGYNNGLTKRCTPALLDSRKELFEALETPSPSASHFIDFFLVVGDNEWNECFSNANNDPKEWWRDRFARMGSTFNKFDRPSGNYPFGITSAPVVERDEDRPELFYFEVKNIAVFGINEPSGTNIAQQDNADFIAARLRTTCFSSLIMFGHSNNFSGSSQKQIKDVLNTYYLKCGNSPTLYVAGNAHPKGYKMSRIAFDVTNGSTAANPHTDIYQLTVEAFKSGPLLVTIVEDPSTMHHYFHILDTQPNNSNSICPM